jgi:hypothetical protein
VPVGIKEFYEIEARAARHLAVEPIAEPRATNHEIVPLRLGLKSEDATSSWISPASEEIHGAFFLAVVSEPIVP